jgi:hypothetical protein
MRRSRREGPPISTTCTKATDTTPSHRPSTNTKRTSNATCTEETIIDPSNGDHGPTDDTDNENARLELRDVLVIETNDGQSLEFEVVGLVEDDENNAYAVCYSEKADEFVVTDDTGNLLSNDELAQEILDDFFVLAEESGDAPPPAP